MDGTNLCFSGIAVGVGVAGKLRRSAALFRIFLSGLATDST